MSVPTTEQIIDALRIPEIETKLDRLGRVVRKKNYNINQKPARGSKIFYKNVSTAEVIRVKARLYNH